jgi:hypothetical protein
VLVAVSALAMVGRTVRAQDLARLEARADSLLRQWRLAQRVADLVDSLEAARAGAGRDTVRSGSLRIVTSPSPLPLQAAADLAWPAVDSLLGDAASRLADRPYVLIPWDPDTAVAPPTIRAGIGVRWDLDALAVRDLLWANLPLDLDGPLIAWLGGPGLRPSSHPARQREAAYVELVTAPSTAMRACFLGDLGSCRGVLDLGGPTDALDRWYPTPSERRTLAAGPLGGFFGRGGREGTLRACLAGADSACANLLRSLPGGTLTRPLGHAGRDTFLKLALQLGGRDSYLRLVADPGAPIVRRIEASAGMSVDSVIARWRSSILASRPTPVSTSGFGWWIGLGWAAVFAGCALRSSRWRVG